MNSFYKRLAFACWVSFFGTLGTPTYGQASAAPNNIPPKHFDDYYNSLQHQLMDAWVAPTVTPSPKTDIVIKIHIEKDGSIPADKIQLVQSSGNVVYDDSAVAAAKSLGRLYQPLPDGCPPDIPITFKLTR